MNVLVIVIVGVSIIIVVIIMIHKFHVSVSNNSWIHNGNVGEETRRSCFRSFLNKLSFNKLLS